MKWLDRGRNFSLDYDVKNTSMGTHSLAINKQKREVDHLPQSIAEM